MVSAFITMIVLTSLGWNVKVEFDKDGRPFVVQFKNMNKISLMPDEFRFLFTDPRNPTKIFKYPLPGMTILYEIVASLDADWYNRKRPGIYTVYMVLPEQHIFLRQYGEDHETTVAWNDIDWNGFKVLFK